MIEKSCTIFGPRRKTFVLRLLEIRSKKFRVGSQKKKMLKFRISPHFGVQGFPVSIFEFVTPCIHKSNEMMILMGCSVRRPSPTILFVVKCNFQFIHYVMRLRVEIFRWINLNIIYPFSIFVLHFPFACICSVLNERKMEIGKLYYVQMYTKIF